jgi:hypothetical protein
MKKVSEYRQHASECRALAAKMEIQENRSQLLAMAKTWDQLAEERAQRVALDEQQTFKSKPQEPPQGAQ